MIKCIKITAIAAALCLMAPMAAFADSGDKRRGDINSRKASITFPAATAQSGFQSNFSGQRIATLPVQVAALAISPSRAKAIALAKYKGAEYLDMNLVGGNTWVVRLVYAGERIKVKVDANTGRIIG